MQNVYLPPFRAGVEAGAGSVMSAYMDLNNVPASGNVHMLQDILRKELNFQGFVVSDAFAVGRLVTQGFAQNGKDAALLGAIARTAAARSVVLLRNEGGLLPLAKTTRWVAVIGPLGNSKGDMHGRNTQKGFSSPRSFPPPSKASLGPGWRSPGASRRRQMQSALELAGRSDVVIMALGELSGMDFEYASRSSLSLPGRQQELLEKIQALGKPVVLLMFSTRPLDLSWASEHIPAIMDCSSEAQKPATRLQIFSWATRCQGANCPSHGPRIYYAHTASHKPYDSADFSSRYWDLPTSPLYSFGYGLSYSTFSISDFHLGERLPPHHTATRAKHEISFIVDREERNYWSGAKNGWVIEPSDFDVWVGNSSTTTLHDSFSVVQ
jgi:beta-glucosidase